eukprot:5578699-Amphidinium_carterae.5
MTEVAHIGFVSIDKDYVLRHGLTGEAVALREHALLAPTLKPDSRVELAFLEGYGLLYIDGSQSAYVSELFTRAIYEDSSWFFQADAGSTIWVDRSFWSVDFVRVQIGLDASHFDVTANHFKAHTRGCKYWFELLDLYDTFEFGSPNKHSTPVLWLQLKYWCGFANDIGLSESLLYKKPVDVKKESIWHW